MVKPKARRTMVDYLQQCFGLSLTRACKLASISRASYKYISKPTNDKAVRERLKELASKRPKNGSPMFHSILRREGLVQNHKRTERLYKEEGLTLRRKTRKKLKSQVRVPLPIPAQPGQQWAMDFMSHSFSDGR